MSIWDNAVSGMDSALMAEFSVSVTIHLSDGDKQVKGIFDNPYTTRSLLNGGDVRDSEPELYLEDGDAGGVERNQLVTISNQKWQVVKPPEPDGTGLTKLILGHTNGQPTARPTIRYRS